MHSLLTNFMFMKKSVLKLSALFCCLSVLALSCQKESQEQTRPEPDVPSGPVAPEKQSVNLTMNPSGGEQVVDVTATDSWTLEKDENYKWLTVTPEKGGAGTSTITFTAEENLSGRERSASFFVMQGTATIYEIFIAQAKKEIALGEGDYNFLKSIVDNKYLGDDTPVVEDWYSFTGEEFAGTGIELSNIDGKWYVVQIDRSSKDVSMTGLPEALELEYCERIRLNNQAGLAGVLFPQVWKTPKLAHIALSHTRMTGAIPQGFADSPLLSEVYFDDTDFYGALPHIWASKVLEVCLLGSKNNGTFKGDDPYAGDTECPYLGYMVPASLDVVLNSKRSGVQNDKTQMKLGGVNEGHWLGFEEGWGQERYELFDSEAVKGDITVWSDWRLLIGKAENDPDVWAWYFSNMGYNDPNYLTYIPRQMMKWDQDVADKFTAAAKAAHDSKQPIDMTAFGKVPVETPDDDITAGNLINVEDDFWGNK